jgi:hypothetical protein
MVSSATMSNVDGGGCAFLRRDAQQFRALLARTVALPATGRGGRHRECYRAAEPELTSVDFREKMFRAITPHGNDATA